MNDRELLELAAKAAGYEVWPGRGHQDEMLFIRLEKPDPTGRCSGREWNPLTDDGDALRLAVKLRITPRFAGFGVDASDGGRGMAYERYGSDCGISTRRAIVRAAAAIGEAMQ